MYELHTTRSSVPAECPLSRLTDEDRQYLLSICDPTFRPDEFNKGDSFSQRWQPMIEELKAKGFTDEQARVMVGMGYNGFTSINLSDTGHQ